MPRYVVRGQRVSPSETERARELRRVMTPAERTLWAVLRRNQLNGLQFRRQQIIGGYIADFYCHSIGLAIEVDGDVHARQVEYDRTRDAFIATYGISILRFSNDEVMNDLESVLDQILAKIDKRSAPDQASTERTGRQ